MYRDLLIPFSITDTIEKVFSNVEKRKSACSFFWLVISIVKSLHNFCIIAECIHAFNLWTAENKIRNCWITNISLHTEVTLFTIFDDNQRNNRLRNRSKIKWRIRIEPDQLQKCRSSSWEVSSLKWKTAIHLSMLSFFPTPKVGNFFWNLFWSSILRSFNIINYVFHHIKVKVRERQRIVD